MNDTKYALRIFKDKLGKVVVSIELPGTDPGKGTLVGPGESWHPTPYDVDNLPGIYGVLNETGKEKP